MSPLNRKLVRTLIRLGGQLASVTAVVAAGTGTLVAMWAVYFSLVTTRDRYYVDNRFGDVFVHVRRAPKAAAQQLLAIPGVAAVEPRVVTNVTLAVPGLEEPGSGHVVSVPDDHLPQLNVPSVVRGQWLPQGVSGAALISPGFADTNHVGPGDSLRAIINGQWKTLHIVGVALSPEFIIMGGRTSLFPDDRREAAIWMSEREVASALNLTGAFNDAVLQLAKGASDAEVTEAVDRLLVSAGGTGAYGRGDQPSHRTLAGEIAQNRAQAVFLPTLFLLVAAFLLHVVLSRHIALERRQIGVLKAFGYPTATIVRHYVLVGLAPAIMGAMLGVGIGLYLGQALFRLYEGYYRFPHPRFIAPPLAISVAALVSIATAVLGAASAVRRVAALPPADAMRPEAPAAFNAGIVDRLGIAALLGPTGRMMLRYLARRPLRAGLSVLSIAAGGCMLVTGLAMFDAVWYMIDVHFSAADRGDVTVLFTSLRPVSARDALLHVPGVRTVELFRVVPVRVVAGSRSRRSVLTGLEPGGQLRQLADRYRHVTPVPPFGIVMTADLARRLGVRRGDSVVLEALEERRARAAVPVISVVDEMLGSGVYMSAAAADRFMETGPAASGAYITVDPRAEPDVYLRIERLPATAGAAIRELGLVTFRRVMAQSVGITTTALVVAAVVVAFGMVYNGGRVALAERSHELASMRVLGFSTGEVGRMLLGEQGIVTVLAIPIGWALGLGVAGVIVRISASDTFRMRLVATAATAFWCAVTVGGAALLSGVIVQRRVRSLDLITALKAPE